MRVIKLGRSLFLAFLGSFELLGCSGGPPTHAASTGEGGDIVGGDGGPHAGTDASRSDAKGAPDATPSSIDAASPVADATSGVADAPSDALVSPTDICRAAITADCQRREECGSTQTTCLALAELCPDYYFGADSNQTIDSLLSCIPTLRKTPCMDIQYQIPPLCLEHGARPDGAGCLFDSQCASRLCEGTDGECGHCALSAKLNEQCWDSRPCEKGAYCTKYDGHCALIGAVKHGQEGARCDVFFSNPAALCTGDLDCTAELEGTEETYCVRRQLEGEPCGYPTPVGCAPGLECSFEDPSGASGKCVKPSVCGALTCDASSYCSRPNHVCAPRATEGQSCRTDGVDPPCAPGLVCTLRLSIFPGGGICLPPDRGIGATCKDLYDCYYPLNCSAGQCAPLSPASCPATPI